MKCQGMTSGGSYGPGWGHPPSLEQWFRGMSCRVEFRMHGPSSQSLTQNGRGKTVWGAANKSLLP